MYIIKQQTSPSNFPCFGLPTPESPTCFPRCSQPLLPWVTSSQSTTRRWEQRWRSTEPREIPSSWWKRKGHKRWDLEIILGYLRETYMIYIYMYICMGNFVATDFRENYIEIYMMTFDLKLIFSGLSRQYSSVFGKMIFPSTLVFFKSRSCGELKSPQEHVNISEGIEDNVICIFFHQSLRSLALPDASCHTKSHRRKPKEQRKSG